MSWTSCMKSKINDHFGADAAACADAGSKDDLKDIATCILGIVEDADPETLLAQLAGWSIECAL